jgi:hypothetical protein
MGAALLLGFGCFWLFIGQLMGFWLLFALILRG